MYPTIPHIILIQSVTPNSKREYLSHPLFLVVPKGLPKTWISKIFSFLLYFIQRKAIDKPLRTVFYFLNTFTSNDATDVTIPMKENQRVVELPIPEFLAFTLFG